MISHCIRQLLCPLADSVCGGSQFAYLPNRDIVQAIQEAKTRLSNGEYTAFLDVTKAFDNLPHETIVTVLNSLRIPQHLLRLIQGVCLTGKTRIILHDGSTTEPIELLSGVKQGDPSSPFLFIICVSILRSTNIQLIQYADDIAISADSPAALQHAIATVCHRLSALGLMLNARKSVIVPPTSVMLSDDTAPLPVAESTRYLGVLVGPKIQAEQAFQPVLPKMRQAAFAIKRLKLPPSKTAALFTIYVTSKCLHIATIYTLDEKSRKELKWIARSLFGKVTTKTSGPTERNYYFGSKLETLSRPFEYGGIKLKEPTMFCDCMAVRWYNIINFSPWLSPYLQSIKCHVQSNLQHPDVPQQIQSGFKIADRCKSRDKFIRVARAYENEQLRHENYQAPGCVIAAQTWHLTITTTFWKNFWKLSTNIRVLNTFHCLMWRTLPLPEFTHSTKNPECVFCHQGVAGPTHWFWDDHPCANLPVSCSARTLLLQEFVSHITFDTETEKCKQFLLRLHDVMTASKATFKMQKTAKKPMPLQRLPSPPVPSFRIYDTPQTASNTADTVPPVHIHSRHPTTGLTLQQRFSDGYVRARHSDERTSAPPSKRCRTTSPEGVPTNSYTTPLYDIRRNSHAEPPKQGVKRTHESNTEPLPKRSHQDSRVYTMSEFMLLHPKLNAPIPASNAGLCAVQAPSVLHPVVQIDIDIESPLSLHHRPTPHSPRIDFHSQAPSVQPQVVQIDIDIESPISLNDHRTPHSLD